MAVDAPAVVGDLNPYRRKVYISEFAAATGKAMYIIRRIWNAGTFAHAGASRLTALFLGCKLFGVVIEEIDHVTEGWPLHIGIGTGAM